MNTVFISYSHSDSGVADSIVETLNGIGIDYFRDVKNIQLGDPISTRVRQGLKDAAAIIVIVSPGSLKSQWVPYEVGFGTGRGIRVLPYLTHPEIDLPGFMSDLLYAKCCDELSEYFTKNPNWHHQLTEPLPKLKSQTATLTDMQVKYLTEISKPRNNGSIYGGIDRDSGRDVAPYQEALELFQEYGLMQYNGGGYKLTAKGWQLVDQLWALAIVDALKVEEYADDTSIAEAVGLTDGKTELDELHRHIDALKQKGFVNSMRTSSGVCAALTLQGATYRKHRPIEPKAS